MGTTRLEPGKEPLGIQADECLGGGKFHAAIARGNRLGQRAGSHGVWQGQSTRIGDLCQDGNGRRGKLEPLVFNRPFQQQAQQVGAGRCRLCRCGGGVAFKGEAQEVQFCRGVFRIKL